MANLTPEQRALLEERLAQLEAEGKEEPSAISMADRLIVKNFASNPEKALSYIKGKYPDLDVMNQDGEVFFKGKNEDEYKPMDPAGFDVGDIGDVGYDVASMIAQGAAGLGGAAAGPLGAAGAAAATSAGSDALKQALGAALGIEDNFSGQDIAANAGIAGLTGGALPLLGKGAQKAGSWLYNKAPMMQRLAQGEAQGAIKLLEDQDAWGTAKHLANTLEKEKESALGKLTALGQQLDKTGVKAKYKEFFDPYVEKMKLAAADPTRPVLQDEAVEILSGKAPYSPSRYLPLEERPAGMVRKTFSDMLPDGEITDSAGNPLMRSVKRTVEEMDPGFEGVDFSGVVKQKRDLYKMLNPQNFKQEDYSKVWQGVKDSAHILKNISEDVAERAGGNADEVRRLNQVMSDVLTAEKPAASEALKTINAKPLGAVTLMAAATDPALLAGKVVGNFAGSTLGATSTGVGLKKLGRTLARENKSKVGKAAALGLSPALIEFMRSQGILNEGPDYSGGEEQ